MVTLEELVPKDHLLRLIDRHIRFDFIFAETAHLYCADNGRPALDPVRLFKMLFIGYLFGIRSERQLVREIQVNVAYRWFLGLRLTDKVIDASTFSQNRRRRYAGTDIEQTIFDRIVEQAIGQGLIGGRVFYTDSTHLKASAHKNKHQIHEVAQTPVDYLAELEAAIAEDRTDHDKPPLSPQEGVDEPPMEKVKVSPSDPEAGYMVRDGKPSGFFYLDHRTVDGRHALITDIHVTPANLHDSVPYLKRLDRMRERFGFEVGAVGLDAGYFTPAICRGLEQRNIYGVIGSRRPSRREGYLPKREYRYDRQQDVYICPNGQALHYRTTNRNGYREYASSPTPCANCLMKGQCTRSVNGIKVVTRHVWQDHKEAVDAYRLEEKGKRLYARRKETVERSFADAKELHGHRYARFRGLAKVKGQCLLAAACQNMKIARLLARALLRFLQHAMTAITPSNACWKWLKCFTSISKIMTSEPRWPEPNPIKTKPHQKWWGSSAA